MALPKELTNIPVDNDYSMDEAAIIESLIRSGKISTQQVSDYFKLPVTDINRVLSQDFGYSTDNLGDALTGKTIQNVGADFTPATTQTKIETRPRGVVEQNLSTQRSNEFPTGDGVISPKEREKINSGFYQALPDGSIINYMGVRYNADLATNNLTSVENPAFKGIPREGFTTQQADQVAEAIRSGKASINDARSYFKIPQEVIENTLIQNYGFTPEQIKSSRIIRPQGLIEGTNRFAKTGLEDEARFDNFTETASQVARDTGAASGAASGAAARRSIADIFSGIAVDNDYSMDDARAVENALRTGQVTMQQVSDYFGVPIADISRVLTTDFGYTPDRLRAIGGTDTNGTVTDRTSTGGQGQNIFSQMGQQGVGQDLTNVMGGQQGYTGGTLQDGNIRYNDPNVIGGQVNMPQVGVIGAEAALQGGLSGGLAGLQEGLATGATGLTGAVASGLQELRRALGQGRQDITAGYGRAEEGFQPYMQGGAAAQSQLEALSGARGQEAFQQAYQESPQMAFLREQGMRANLAGAAATGGLGGGNVQKELQRFGQGLASQGLQQQIENLRGLTGQGLQAAQGAGQYAAGGAGQLAGLEQTQGTQALGAMQNVGQQLANLGLAGGQTAAQMGYGTGQSLADIRTRAGELMAGEISNVSRDTSNLAAALGGNISNVYGSQAQQIAQLLVNSGMSQADAAQQTAQMLANISVGAGGQVAGLGTSVGQPQQQQGILGQVGQAASGIATAGGSAGFGWW